MIYHNPLDQTHDKYTSLSASIPSVTSVQGRLKHHKDLWLNELEPSSFVAVIIKEGYRLPF